VFTEVCGDKSFSSRSPGPKLKVLAVAVASCSVAPINAPRIRSSKRGSSSVSESTSSGVKPSTTRSLESSKRKRKTSERTSDAELQAASVTTQEFRCVNFAKIKNFLTEIECYQFSSQIASPLLKSPPD
jgi:hypothetical protein